MDVIKTPVDKLRETTDLLTSLTDHVGRDAAVFVVAAIRMLDAAIDRARPGRFSEQAAQVARAAMDLQFIDGLPVPASLTLMRLATPPMMKDTTGVL
jgi:hypothetical protein